MSVPCSAPSVVILNQQRQNINCSDESDETSSKNDCAGRSAKGDRDPGEYCTVVENGKVVVKPIESSEKTSESQKS
jgi:hypothetical protein